MPTEQAADMALCHLYSAVDSAGRHTHLKLQEMYGLLGCLRHCCTSCRVCLHRTDLSLALNECMQKQNQHCKETAIKNAVGKPPVTCACFFMNAPQLEPGGCLLPQIRGP